ncbi:MAG: PTS sugar transporter subunit IIA [Planctomycetes bacterium]|nr:PTS sugar transporter subunit IIA [Planctomycetota bacterium]
MKFQEFVCRKALIADLQGKTTPEVLTEMVEALAAAGSLSKSKKSDVLNALLQREKKATTGFGNGVAIPHVKHDGVKDLVGMVARSAEGVDFAALDGDPVYTFFMLVSPPDKPAEHLKAMENIFRNAQKEHWRRFLRQAETADAIWELLVEADEEAIV